MSNLEYSEALKNIAQVADAFSLIADVTSEDQLQNLKSPFLKGSDADQYVGRIRQTLKDPDTAFDLRGIEFRPFLLTNGMIHATQGNFEFIKAFFPALSIGLKEFSSYLAVVGYRLPSPADELDLKYQQSRYFAYCISQLIEFGMGFDGILKTMKGDSLDQETSYAVRDVLEGVVEFSQSPLFNDIEKQWWETCFKEADNQQVWTDLQAFFVKEYKLPFVRYEPS